MEVFSICPCGNQDEILQDETKGCEGFYFVLGQIYQRECTTDHQRTRASIPLLVSDHGAMKLSECASKMPEIQPAHEEPTELEPKITRKKSQVAKINPVANNTVPVPPPIQSNLVTQSHQFSPPVNIAAAIADFHRSGKKLRHVSKDTDNGKPVRQENENPGSSGHSGGIRTDSETPNSGEDLQEALKKRIPAVYGTVDDSDAEDADDW